MSPSGISELENISTTGTSNPLIGSSPLPDQWATADSTLKALEGCATKEVPFPREMDDGASDEAKIHQPAAG